MDKYILRRWLQAGYIDEGTLFESVAGTPQGGIISPVIANMALDGLKAAVYASVCPTKHGRSKSQLNVIRYADDFVVTGGVMKNFKAKYIWMSMIWARLLNN